MQVLLDLLGVILEVYIDDIVIESAGLCDHFADLKLAQDAIVWFEDEST